MQEEASVDDPAERSAYDDFAWIYSKYWGPGAVALEMPVLERLLLHRLRPGARILDVCCGSGQIAARLLERGFSVTGADSSQVMLLYASEHAPLGEFFLADARSFTLDAPCDAAISTFESLNHMPSLDDLRAVFARVHAALVPGGIFYFDLNTDEGMRARWNGDMKIHDAGRVCHIRLGYSPETWTGRMHIAISPAGGDGPSQTFDIFERHFPAEDVQRALEAAGFTQVERHNSQRDLGLDAIGIDYYLGTKPR
jgi:SAM-dependent methyltransferase